MKFVENLLKQLNINSDRLFEIISSVTDNTDDLFRVYAYLSNAKDKPDFVKSFEKDDSVYTFERYDLVHNRVYYNSVKSEIRYFKTEEEAKEAANKTYSYYSVPGTSKPQDNSIASTKVHITRSDYMRSEEWPKN